MKNILLIMMLSFSACSLVDLDTPMLEVAEETMTTISPDALPASQSDAIDMFSGANGKSWRAVGFTIMGVSGMLECRVDDRITINADGTYEFDGGQSLCGAEDNTRFQSGTWQINDLGDAISFTLDGEAYTSTITGFVADTLALSGQYRNFEIEGLYVAE